MLRHGFRPLEFIPFYAGQRRTIEIPRDKLIKNISLYFTAALVVADPGGGAAGAVNQDAALRMAPMIELIADGTVILCRASARMLWHHNLYTTGNAGLNTPPTAGAAATYNIYFEVNIPFENAGGAFPQDSFLNAPSYRSLVLAITWGQPSHAFSAAHTMTDTIAATYGIYPLIEETVQPAPTFVRTIEEVTKYSPAAATDFYIDFAAPNQKSIIDLLVMSTAAAAPVDLRVNTIINYLTLRSGTVRHFDRLAAARMQALNSRLHVGATQQATNVGLIYLPLREDGLITSGFNLADTNTARLELDVNAVGTDNVHCLIDAMYAA